MAGLQLVFCMIFFLTAAFGQSVTPSTFSPGATVSEVDITITLSSSLTAGDTVNVTANPNILLSGTTMDTTPSCLPSETVSGSTITGVLGTCTVPASTFVITLRNLGTNPTAGSQSFTVQTSKTNSIVVSYDVVATQSPTSATLCVTVPTIYNTVGGLSALTSAQLDALATSMQGIGSGTSDGALVCATVPANIWMYEIYNPGWIQTASSTEAPSVTITYWGWMYTDPMLAIVITYPVNDATKQMLNLPVAPRAYTSSLVPVGSDVEFIVRIDRLTTAGDLANDPNPIHFEVAVDPVRIVQVLVVNSNLATGAQPVAGNIGLWAQSSSTWIVMVRCSHGGLFIGYGTTTTSPIPDDDGSDEALLGLLALIAIPFMCCCCLALWAWWRAKNEPFPCCPTQCQCPCPCVQECTGVTSFPVVTTTTVPLCTTPAYAPPPYY